MKNVESTVVTVLRDLEDVRRSPVDLTKPIRMFERVLLYMQQNNQYRALCKAWEAWQALVACAVVAQRISEYGFSSKLFRAADTVYLSLK